MDDVLPVGAALRQHRLAAGLSLGDLAARVHYSKGYLSKIENGAKHPGPDLLRRCDTALAANGALDALAPSESTGSTEPEPAPELGWLLAMAPEDGPILGRREMLAVGGSIPLLAATASGPARPPAADGPVTDGFGAMLAELRKLGQSQPPALLLPILEVQVRTLISLARSGRSSSTAALLMLTSRFAEYTGWMAQESGDDQAMIRWTNLAVRCANGAGDQELSAYAYVRHANAAMYRADGAATVELADRALSEVTGTQRVRALALQRQAQGYALLGRQDDCRRALDQAETLFGRMSSPATGSSTPVLGTTTVANPSDLVLGWCLHDLGRSEDAVPVLERHLAQIPASARRARARVTGRLALASAGAGDPAAACTLAHQVLDDETHVDSATLRHDLRHLGRALSRWRSRPDVQTVSPRLAQALRSR